VGGSEHVVELTRVCQTVVVAFRQLFYYALVKIGAPNNLERQITTTTVVYAPETRFCSQK
jgi:hypothetical protein